MIRATSSLVGQVCVCSKNWQASCLSTTSYGLPCTHLGAKGIAKVNTQPKLTSLDDDDSCVLYDRTTNTPTTTHAALAKAVFCNSTLFDKNSTVCLHA